MDNTTLELIARIETNNNAFNADVELFITTGKGGDLPNPMPENQRIENVILSRIKGDKIALKYMQKQFATPSH